MGVGGDIGGGLGQTLGSIAVLMGAGGKGGDEYDERALALWEKLKTPNFDVRALTAPELQVMAMEFPQLYEAWVPDDVKMVNDSPEMRQAQIQGLQKFQQISETGATPAERVASQQAMDSVMATSGRINNDVLANMAQRGRLGTSAEIRGRSVGNAQSANLAHDLGASLMQQREGQRIAAAGTAAGLAGQIRGTDISQRELNARIQNNFNALVAEIKNEAAARNAAERARARSANVGRANLVSDTNTMNRYNVAERNQQYGNEMKQQGFQNDVTKTSGYAGALNSMGLKKDQDKAAKERTIMSLGQGAGQAVGGAAEAIYGGGATGMIAKTPQGGIYYPGTTKDKWQYGAVSA